jgi:hypothetical protein
MVRGGGVRGGGGGEDRERMDAEGDWGGLHGMMGAWGRHARVRKSWRWLLFCTHIDLRLMYPGISPCNGFKTYCA